MRILRLIIFTLLCHPLVAGAESLLEIYRQALVADPVWLGAKANNRAAQEATEQSRSVFLPQIGLTADTYSNFQDTNSNFNPTFDDREKFNSNSWNLNITQSVFRMENYAAHRQAQDSVRQADTLFASSAQDLIVRVSDAYFRVLGAESDLTAVQANKKAIARQLDQAQKRFEVGLIAITDVHEAQAGYDLAVANEITAKNALLVAQVELSEITGRSYKKLNDLRDNLEPVQPEPANIDDWVQRAIDNNLAISAAMDGVEIAQENVKIQRAGHYPSLDLVATTGNNTSHNRTGSDTDGDTIGLQFSLPLYTGGRVTSQTRQALAELDQARESLTEAKRATERQAREAYLNILSEMSRVQALEQAVVSAQSAVDATEAGFEVGTRTIVDVLNVQRELYSSITELQKTRYIYLLNGLRLKQAVGSLSEDDVAAIDRLLAPATNQPATGP